MIQLVAKDTRAVGEQDDGEIISQVELELQLQLQRRLKLLRPRAVPSLQLVDELHPGVDGTAGRVGITPEQGTSAEQEREMRVVEDSCIDVFLHVFEL